MELDLIPIPSGDERAPMTPEERATCLTQIRASIEEEAVRIGLEHMGLEISEQGDQICTRFLLPSGKKTCSFMSFAVIDGGMRTPDEAGKSIVDSAAFSIRYWQREEGKQ